MLCGTVVVLITEIAVPRKEFVVPVAARRRAVVSEPPHAVARVRVRAVRAHFHHLAMRADVCAAGLACVLGFVVLLLAARVFHALGADERETGGADCARGAAAAPVRQCLSVPVIRRTVVVGGVVVPVPRHVLVVVAARGESMITVPDNNNKKKKKQKVVEKKNNKV